MTQTNSRRPPVVADFLGLDLDVVLDGMELAPVPVQLGGHTYYVRRDLTGAQVRAYHRLAGEQRDVEAMALLVGADDAPTLIEFLDELPQPKMVRAVQEIMRVAGVILVPGTPAAEAGKPGESSAS